MTSHRYRSSIEKDKKPFQPTWKISFSLACWIFTFKPSPGETRICCFCWGAGRKVFDSLPIAEQALCTSSFKSLHPTNFILDIIYICEEFFFVSASAFQWLKCVLCVRYCSLFCCHVAYPYCVSVYAFQIRRTTDVVVSEMFFIAFIFCSTSKKNSVSQKKSNETSHSWHLALTTIRVWTAKKARRSLFKQELRMKWMLVVGLQKNFRKINKRIYQKDY